MKAKEEYSGGLNISVKKTKELSQEQLEKELHNYGENNGSDVVKTVTDDLDQCQSVTNHGQCIRHREPGSKFCEVHGGNSPALAMMKKSANIYRIQANTSGKDELSLRQEIALQRVLTEELWRAGESSAELVLNAPALTAMLLSTERLVSSCTKIEAQLGNHLTEEQAQAFASEVLKVITEHIVDKQILESIGRALAEIGDKYFGN